MGRATRLCVINLHSISGIYASRLCVLNFDAVWKRSLCLALLVGFPAFCLVEYGSFIVVVYCLCPPCSPFGQISHFSFLLLLVSASHERMSLN